jgi:hypothetical protein
MKGSLRSKESDIEILGEGGSGGRQKIKPKTRERKFVQGQLELVRKKFFPKWDRKREWTIKFYMYDPSSYGRCDHKSKTIFVSFCSGFLHCDLKRLVSDIRSMGVKLTPRQALWFLLIHEVCHAVNNPFEYHGARFQQRMLKVSKRAEEIGHLRLSEALYEEAELLKYISMYGKRLISVLQKSSLKGVKPSKPEPTRSRSNL